MTLALALGLPLLIILGPLAVLCAAFLWKLHADDRHEDTRVKKPILRLSLILAITGSIGAFAMMWLAVASVLRLRGELDLLNSLTPITLLAIIGLGFIPIINAGYLWWLRRGRFRSEHRRRPPPFGPDD